MRRVLLVCFMGCLVSAGSPVACVNIANSTGIDAIKTYLADLSTELRETYERPVLTDFRYKVAFSPEFWLERHEPQFSHLEKMLLNQAEGRVDSAVDVFFADPDTMRNSIRRQLELEKIGSTLEIRTRVVWDHLNFRFRGTSIKAVFDVTSYRYYGQRHETIGNKTVVVSRGFYEPGVRNGHRMVQPNVRVHREGPPNAEDQAHEVFRFHSFLRSSPDVGAEYRALLEMLFVVDAEIFPQICSESLNPPEPRIEERDGHVVAIWTGETEPLPLGSAEAKEQVLRFGGEMILQPGSPWLLVGTHQWLGDEEDACSAYDVHWTYRYARDAEGRLYVAHFEERETQRSEVGDVVVTSSIDVEKFDARPKVSHNLFTIAEKPEETVFLPVPGM